MKSIKEQQTEYVLAHTDAVESYEAYAEKEEIAAAFEAGANYVLEQIEKLTNNQNWCAFPKQSHKELKKLIEQLKK